MKATKADKERKFAKDCLTEALEYIDMVFEDNAKATVDDLIERHRNGRAISHAA